jgi:arylsulfatase
LYAYTPARLAYSIVIPERGRLDFALGILRDDSPVTFRVAVQPEANEAEVIFEMTSADRTRWSQHSVDLARWAGGTVRLTLEASAERDGTLAVWAAPTISGTRRSTLPNIIFYVIDGAGADFMSVYGYERDTTPHLDALAAEGAVFERAYSNSTWTEPSTASFTTSLHHSVLGGFDPEASPVLPGVTTLAEHLHRAGYFTMALTSNPIAGRIVGPGNGTDVLLTDYVHDSRASSAILDAAFWRLRADYPAEPYWAHFQSTDVHPPYASVRPFAGRYVSTERRAELLSDNQDASRGAVGLTNIFMGYDEQLDRLGVDATEFYDEMRGLYDEAMEHQDYQLGRLVQEIESRGEWQDTLFIIASDHGHPAGSFPRFGRGLIDPKPPDWEGALFDAHNTHIPLIFIWPGHIGGGQRFAEPVSMIDVLPTILELVGLPPPDLTQGQSLAHLLLGEEGFTPRPVVLDEFRRDRGTAGLIGNIEIVDGRWGASLEIGPARDALETEFGRHAIPAAARGASPYFPDIPRLLLYDLSIDPFAVQHVNESYPRLVEQYSELLQRQWKVHQALGRRFESDDAIPLTPDELRALRSLGYIQ